MTKKTENTVTTVHLILTTDEMALCRGGHQTNPPIIINDDKDKDSDPPPAA